MLTIADGGGRGGVGTPIFGVICEQPPTFDTHRRTKSCSTLEVKCPSVKHLVGAIYASPLLVIRAREEEVNAPCVVLVLVAWVAVQEGVRHICIQHRFEVSPSCYGAMFLYVVKRSKLGDTCTWGNQQSDRRDHRH